ncbi:hypothetical protein K8R30_00615 [archaeon]|nr:hypothetical protein [archaeon]
MRRPRNIFVKKKSKPDISDKELANWVSDGLRKRHSLSHLRNILINHGLEDDNRLIRFSSKVTHRHKGYPIKIIGAILLFVCVSIFTFFFILSPGNFMNGYVILGSEDPGVLISVDFSSEIGVIRGDFYGVGLQSPILVSGSIDTNCDGVYETPRNYTWQQETFLDSGAKITYYDTYLENYYFNTSEDSGINMQGDLTDIQNQLIWDYENNITSIIIMGYMPPWLADNSSGNCLNLRYCPASNYTKWNNIVLDFYKRVDRYRNVTKIEIWNEPDIFFFEGKLPSYSAKTDFVILFNNTFNTFKYYNSNIEIVGWRGAQDAVTTSSISAFTRMMLSNLSSQHKSFSYHPYYENYINYPMVSSELNYLFTQCAVYDAECSHVYLDEWQPHGTTAANILKNQSLGQSDEYKANIAYFLQDILNHYPEKITEMPYHWDDPVSYFNCPSNYPEYPAIYSSVSEAGLDNPVQTYYPAYTIPKNFATYHSAGSMVVRSNSSSNSIKVVASKKQDDVQYITIINTGNKTNVSLVLSGNSYSNLKDLETNEVYLSDNNNIINIGVLDEYEIKYLINTAEGSTLLPDTDIPPQDSSSESSGGGDGSNPHANANATNNIYTNLTNQDNNSGNIDVRPKIEEEVKNQKDEIKIGKNAGTGKAILGELEKYVSGIIVLLVIGITVVLLIILYVWSRRNGWLGKFN